MFFVINTNRPFTSNSTDIKEYIKAIERASRLKVSHLISNTNLSYETEPAAYNRWRQSSGLCYQKN